MTADHDAWDAWYMAYPATAIWAALAFAILFFLGLIPVHLGWVDSDDFMSLAKSCATWMTYAAIEVASLWALIDYHHAPYGRPAPPAIKDEQVIHCTLSV